MVLSEKWAIFSLLIVFAAAFPEGSDVPACPCDAFGNSVELMAEICGCSNDLFSPQTLDFNPCTFKIFPFCYLSMPFIKENNAGQITNNQNSDGLLLSKVHLLHCTDRET
ncbi:hypothetical protein D915_000474 [Fasciola hepatica]|uniref:Uncharacterized protein n=1 Tax=Fasciola hepatica TaxID=6192 RepID=A0A4E0S3D4_FASHE|nr:hypothetical protein D915_000474 [Fasciola hepatica]